MRIFIGAVLARNQHVRIKNYLYAYFLKHQSTLICSLDRFAYTDADSVVLVLGIRTHLFFDRLAPKLISNCHFFVSIMATDPRLARLDPRRTTTPTQPPPPPPPAHTDQRPPHGYDGVEDGDGTAVSPNEEGGFKLRFCTVCASNQNRYVFCTPKFYHLSS